MKIKTLLFKFFVLLGLLILLDFLVGKTLDHYYFKQKYGEYYVLTKMIENPDKQTAQLLIFGSSRARRHYNPAIISQTLGMSCYNAGYDAQSILFHKAIFDIIIDKYKPEIVLLDIQMGDLSKDEAAYDRLSVLLPYIRFYPELWNTVSLKSPYERIKYLSKIYPYNSLLDKIYGGNKYFQGENINGFLPFYGLETKEIEEESFSRTEELDKNKVKAFDSFLDACKERKIKLYLVYSPEHRTYLNHSVSLDYMIKKCDEQGVEYISYLGNEAFLKKEIFREFLHLNNIGADLFSQDLALKLKERIK